MKLIFILIQSYLETFMFCWLTILIVIRLFFCFQLSQPPLSESERHMQYIIREKMGGQSVLAPKCRGTILIELMHDMKRLKEELDDRKYGKFK